MKYKACEEYRNIKTSRRCRCGRPKGDWWFCPDCDAKIVDATVRRWLNRPVCLSGAGGEVAYEKACEDLDGAEGRNNEAR